MIGSKKIFCKVLLFLSYFNFIFCSDINYEKIIAITGKSRYRNIRPPRRQDIIACIMYYSSLELKKDAIDPAVTQCLEQEEIVYAELGIPMIDQYNLKAKYKKVLTEFRSKNKSYNRDKQKFIKKELGGKKLTRKDDVIIQNFDRKYFKLDEIVSLADESKRDYRNKQNKISWEYYDQAIKDPTMVKESTKQFDYKQSVIYNKWTEENRLHDQQSNFRTATDQEINIAIGSDEIESNSFDNRLEKTLNDDNFNGPESSTSRSNSRKQSRNLENSSLQAYRFGMSTRSVATVLNAYNEENGSPVKISHQNIHYYYKKFEKMSEDEMLRNLAGCERFNLFLDGKDKSELLSITCSDSNSNFYRTPAAIFYFEEIEDKKDNPKAERYAEAFVTWWTTTQRTIERKFSKFNFKFSNIIGFHFDTTNTNSGWNNGVAVKIERLIREQDPEFQMLSVMCSRHSLETRWGYVLKEISLKIFSKSIPNYKVPKMVERVTTNTEDLDLVAFTWTFNEWYRSDVEFQKLVASSELAVETPLGSTASNIEYPGKDNLGKKLSKLFKKSISERILMIKEIAAVTEPVSVRWSSKAINLQYYVAIRPVMIPYLNQKNYRNPKFEALKNYLLAADDILKDNLSTLWNMNQLYFETLVQTIEMNDPFFNTLAITKRYAQFALDNQLNSDSLVTNLNRQSYLMDGYFAVLSDNQEMKEIITQKSANQLKPGLNPLVSLKKNNAIKLKYSLKDWISFDMKKFIDDDFLYRALNSPLQDQIGSIGISELKRLMIYDNTEAERAIYELKKIGGKPDLVDYGNFQMDRRISKINAVLMGREKGPELDNKKNMKKTASQVATEIAPPKKNNEPTVCRYPKRKRNRRSEEYVLNEDCLPEENQTKLSKDSVSNKSLSSVYDSNSIRHQCEITDYTGFIGTIGNHIFNISGIYDVATSCCAGLNTIRHIWTSWPSFKAIDFKFLCQQAAGKKYDEGGYCWEIISKKIGKVYFGAMTDLRDSDTIWNFFSRDGGFTKRQIQILRDFAAILSNKCPAVEKFMEENSVKNRTITKKREKRKKMGGDSEHTSNFERAHLERANLLNAGLPADKYKVDWRGIKDWDLKNPDSWIKRVQQNSEFAGEVESIEMQTIEDTAMETSSTAEEEMVMETSLTAEEEIVEEIASVLENPVVEEIALDLVEEIAVEQIVEHLIPV